MSKVLLKILAILMMSIPTACATLFNSGGDKEITVTSKNKQTKFYHNGRFIGVGQSATTYASGSGTDVLSGVQKGCAITQKNVKKEISPAFIGGNFLSALLLGAFSGFILGGNTADDNPIGFAVGISVAGIVASSTLNMNLITDAASGSWRSVTYTEYDLTPQCGV